MKTSESKDKKMFEWLPSIVYIVFAWVAYIHVPYTLGVMLVHQNWSFITNPDGCGMLQAFCDHAPKLATQDPKYMQQTQSWEGWNSKLAIYCNNLFWFVLFYVQHSFMSHQCFKKHVFPISQRLERPLFIFSAAFFFKLCFTMQCPLPTVLFEVKNLDMMIALVVLQMFMYVMLNVAIGLLDYLSFMGLTQAHGYQPPELPFVKTGVYGVIRHPIYFCLFAIFWIRVRITEGDLLYMICMSLYIVCAVRFLEEPFLIETIGDEYLEYTHKVPAYCPLRLPGCFMPQQRKKQKKVE